MDSEKTVDIKLNAILAGIRFQRSWRMLDITGNIIDKILKNKKSPFILETDYFTKVGEETNGKILINSNTDCFLKINIDDVIFNHVLDEEKKELANKDINWFFNTIKKFIIPKLIIGNNIKQVNRIGIVYYHYVEKEDISMEFINEMTGNNLGGIKKFSLDFHRKFPVEISIAKKNIDDYRNIIHFIKIKENKKEKYTIGIDCQYYFEPYTDHIEDWDIDAFIKYSQGYLNENFYPWLKKKFKNFNIITE